jgi:hypothetical protein
MKKVYFVRGSDGLRLKRPIKWRSRVYRADLCNDMLYCFRLAEQKKLFGRKQRELIA